LSSTKYFGHFWSSSFTFRKYKREKVFRGGGLPLTVVTSNRTCHL